MAVLTNERQFLQGEPSSRPAGLSSHEFKSAVKAVRAGCAEELRASIRHAIGDEQGHSVFLKSPEDTVLRKLGWFRRGGEVSERQWHDVLIGSRGRERTGEDTTGHAWTRLSQPIL